MCTPLTTSIGLAPRVGTMKMPSSPESVEAAVITHSRPWESKANPDAFGTLVAYSTAFSPAGPRRPAPMATSPSDGDAVPAPPPPHPVVMSAAVVTAPRPLLSNMGHRVKRRRLWNP